MAYQKPSKGQPRTATGLHRNAAFFGDLVDVVGAHKSGQRPPGDGTAFDRRGPMVFIRNDTNANLKLGEVVELGDYLLDEEDPYKWWYEGKAVSTTFRKRYAIAAEPIPEDEIGAAWVRGPAVLRYAGSAPSSGAGFGPKPSTVTLEPGYPCFAVVDDVFDTTEKLAGCTLGEIGTLLCKATAQNSAGSLATDTSDYTIMAGTAGSEASAGFTTQPAIYSRSDIMINEWFYATFRNGTWYADLDDNSWLGKADSAISAGSSGTISLWTGTAGSESDSTSNATSVYNRTSVAIPSGGWVHIVRVNGKFYCEPWSC